ncbi:MAG TPA: VWA domain-containing protein [Thermomicrobiales bacterium]|jgi:Mg-chelatase subunit ChlD
MSNWIGLTFAHPSALWLLLLVPVIGILGLVLGVRRRGLPPAALPLRLGVIVLLTLALAEPLLTEGGGAASTVFVVDRSKSISDGTASGVDQWISSALAKAGSGDRAAVVTFGSSAEVSAGAAKAQDVGRNWAGPDGAEKDNTDIESALALARSLPLGGSRRIVLVSDGAENVGAAMNQAAQAASDGTPIDVLPVDGVGDNDLRVEGAVAPSSVWKDEPVSVMASVVTGQSGAGQLELLVDGQAVENDATTFPAGVSSFTFKPVEKLAPGFHALTVKVSGSPEMDKFAENNEFPLALVVRDAPKVLLVSQPGTDSGRLQDALEGHGAKITAQAPADVSSRVSEISKFDAVILNNVPASALSIDQMAALRDATKKGRGLVVVGGTSSYGPGGYAGTTLEDTLPVTVKVTDGKERQRVALLLVMDKSGSMSYDPLGGTSKIEMAKEAVKLAAEALANGDEVGILAFNDQQQWVVQLTKIDGDATRQTINAAIDGITADGGTEIYSALNVGFDAIAKSDADVRHVVLLSDGKSRTGTDASYQKLIQDNQANRITLSTIAIGDDSDTELLQKLAEWGNGRYHFTEKPEDIPRLTLAEAQSAGSQSVIRGTFHPIQTLPSPIMTGFTPEDLQPLDGYDFAQTKPNAQTILTSERDDPILAKWQFGLGRVVAWTADDGTDFALDWQQWPRYDEFWANMMRWALPDPENRSIQVSVARDGPEAVVTVNSVGDQGDYVDLAKTTATIKGPDGTVRQNLQLYQSGPGEYQLRVAAPQSGAYEIDLQQQRGDEILAEKAGFAVPPSPELQPAPEGHALLAALAARTGGRVLSLDDAGHAFSGTGLSGTALRDYRPVWFVPLTAAFVLLLLELAVRLRFFPRLRGLRLGRLRAV